MLLVKYGGDIYQEDNDGDTALDLAETAELKQAMLCKMIISSYMIYIISLSLYIYSGSFSQ